jgi:Na+/melibiose symporter-like transporter
MFRRIASLSLLLASIALMALPEGIAMTFAPAPNERLTRYYSYFSMMPLGYGDWLPLINAVLTIIIIILLIIKFKKPKCKEVIYCLLACLIASILSWLVFSSFTFIGLGVFVLQLAVFGLELMDKENRAI